MIEVFSVCVGASGCHARDRGRKGGSTLASVHPFELESLYFISLLSP